ncbi:MAG: molybdenum cofactor biosynthesis protein MoaE [Candidatus Ranarchaeia archaeon]
MIGKAGVHRKGAFDLSDLLTEMRQNPSIRKAGCIVVFVGFVRGDVIEGDHVSQLELEAWKHKADKVLEDICQEEEQAEGVFDVRIHHFLGKFDVGEDLVYVVVSAAHRQEAFAALQKTVERYKHEAPIWKKERLVSGTEYWVTEQPRPFGFPHPQAPPDLKK